MAKKIIRIIFSLAWARSRRILGHQQLARGDAQLLYGGG